MNKVQIQKLLKEGTYRGMPLHGELIETHISWVILTPSFAFKIKKPIQYSFLDFSTLDKRKYYCERELKLNQRLSGIYLDIIPVKRHDKHFLLGPGNGEIIDYAVQMSRLQTVKKMDSMLLKNRINPSQIKALAEKIVDFHQHATIVDTPFDKTLFKRSYNDLLSVIDWVYEHIGKDYAGMIERAVSFSDDFLDVHENLIAKRISNGFQRDLHGDLHAKNIFLYEDPIIFDCIEFNDEFRQIDILNELAFFCMDLEAFQHFNLSKEFLKIYLGLFPCMESQQEKDLFTYYKSYRANVRAKVNVLRAIQASEAESIEDLITEVKKYLDLMDDYVSDIKNPLGVI